jgi:WD40 repeat protein
MATSSNGKGFPDSNVSLWETTSGRKISQMQHIKDAEYRTGYPNEVKTIAFSPDGRYLAGTGSNKGKSIWVWEAISGRGVAYMSHEDSVNAIAFSPDGKYLATASNDKTAQVQLWRREDLMAEACARLTRNLEEYEWKLYLPSEPYHKTCPNLPVPKFNDVPELR